ncbi:MAG: VPLPA-CTERM-specific exosortase XrtD [Syntrophorhabdales bacterium]|jgi:exosortase D (VPLPA-CTERM-specific)
METTIMPFKLTTAQRLKVPIYSALLFAVYLSPLKQLVLADWGKEDYSHCWLIPFVLAYLLWEKRRNLATRGAGSWEGIFAFGAGMVLFWLGELGGEYYTMYFSLWLVVIGLVWLHFGWQKIKSAGFIFIVALTMFPLPNIFNFPLSLRLQLISSRLGVSLLHLYGMSAYREGNVIDLGFTQLQVVEACSGLRYLFPLMVLSLILAYWSGSHIWKRVVLFLSSMPIAIVVNGMRIALTGILYSLWGATVAEGFFHGFSGWLIFMLTIPVLLAEVWLLRRLPPKENADRGSGIAEPAKQRRRGGREEMGEQATTDEAEQMKPKSGVQNRKSTFLQPVFIVAMILLGSTLVLSRTIDFREKIPIKKSLSGFPVKVGEWSGNRAQMEQEFVDGLHFTDYAMADYRNPQGKAINFYTAYYESQNKGEAMHSPETCLPGNGWLFREAGAAHVPLGPGRSLPVNRAFMEKVGARELTYYWFAMRGRALTNLYQVKLYTFWDALTRRRTDGALVRLITPVYQNERLEEAEARLQAFTREIVPVLKEYIPE